MQAATEHDQTSLPELLYALILALVPFVDSLLADPACANAPSVRRLARTLHLLRAAAIFFRPISAGPRQPAPQQLPSHPRRTRSTGRSHREAQPRAIRRQALKPVSPRSRDRSTTPPPARTLEL